MTVSGQIGSISKLEMERRWAAPYVAPHNAVVQDHGYLLEYSCLPLLGG